MGWVVFGLVLLALSALEFVHGARVAVGKVRGEEPLEHEGEGPGPTWAGAFISGIGGLMCLAQGLAETGAISAAVR
jgi:hypothetical protein